MTLRRTVGIIGVIACLAFATGCRHYCCWGKRVSEKHCPTDVRKTHVWCFGEDAIFRWPCGPNSEFYGHKPTCWREWPAPAPVWRDVYCGEPMPALISSEEELIHGPAHKRPPAYPSPPGNGGVQEQPPANPASEPEPLPLHQGARSSRLLPEAEPVLWEDAAPLNAFPSSPDVPLEDETNAALRHYLSVEPKPAATP